MLARRLKSKGKSVAILDPLGDPEYLATFHTKNSDEFLAWIKSNRDCFVFVDEGGIAIGRYNEPMNWIATTARHCGHLCFIIVQGVTQLSPIVRGQCDKVYLFRSAKSVGEMLAVEWNEKSLADCDKLERGEFFLASRFGLLKKGKIFLDKDDITYTVVKCDSSEPPLSSASSD